MKNAHLRFGRLHFVKVSRDTTTDIRLSLDRLVADHCEGGGVAQGYLLSVVGSDADIGAIFAAVIEQAVFGVETADGDTFRLNLGSDPAVYRGSLSVPGRKRPLRHLVALSQSMISNDPKARETILVGNAPEFVVGRLSRRFGLPALVEWSPWFSDELTRRGMVRPLIGIGCTPVLVRGTKRRLLSILALGLRAGKISIPDGQSVIRWPDPPGFFDSASGHSSHRLLSDLYQCDHPVDSRQSTSSDVGVATE